MAKFSMTNLTASFANLGIILVRGIVIAVFPRIGPRPRPRWKICKLAAQSVVRKPRKPERALLLSR